MAHIYSYGKNIIYLLLHLILFVCFPHKFNFVSHICSLKCLLGFLIKYCHEGVSLIVFVSVSNPVCVLCVLLVSLFKLGVPTYSWRTYHLQRLPTLGVLLRTSTVGLLFTLHQLYYGL